MSTKNAFKRLLCDSAVGLSEKEICAVLDAELEKEPKMMDAQLIDFCLSELEILQKQQAHKDKNKKHFYGILRAAAIAAILILCSVGGYAAFTQQTLYDGLADIFEDHVIVYFPQQEEPTQKSSMHDSALVQELAECGIDNALLPEKILSGEISAEIAYCMQNDTQTCVQVNINSDLLQGQLLIFKYADTTEYDNAVYQDAKQMRHIQVNGVDVFIFVQSEQTMICYTYASCYYQLSCDLSLKAAEEFVKTIQ